MIASVIPLKANSQRVKGKNFKNLAGKPLYKWVTEKIISLHKEGYIRNYFIYCDEETWSCLDEETQDRFTWLKETGAGKHMDSNGFFRDIAILLNGRWEHIMYTNVTSPLLKMDTYKDCCNAIKSGYDSALTAVALRGRIWNVWNQSMNHDPKTCPRTQEQDPVWLESDGLWLVESEMIINNSRRVGIKPYFCPITNIEQIDINYEDDFEFVEKILGV